jgi:hypothetical protein
VLLLVEPPATSTKGFHTEVAKITKKIRIWIEPLSVSGLLKIFVIFAIYCWQFSHDQHQFGNQIHHQQAIWAQGLSKGLAPVAQLCFAFCQYRTNQLCKACATGE